jgi:uncharacterized protein DUF1186/SEC-C motif-containing protein
MGQALPAGIPTFAETGWTRDALLEALKNEVKLPRREVAVAALYTDEIEPAIIALTERAQAEHLDRASRRLLTRGLVILGGRRYVSLYRPLVAFLRGQRDPFEVLPEVFINLLPKVLAGVFDGDLELLTTLLTDDEASEFGRGGAFLALAFLTFDGRIPRETAVEILRRFEQENIAPPADGAWVGWMDAVALLGLSQLSPRVEKAFDDGRLPGWMVSRNDFREALRKAIQRPNDRKRFEDQQLGYIDDVLSELDELGDFEEDLEDQDQAATEQDNAAIEPSRPREIVEPPEGWSSLEQTGYTREDLVEALSYEAELPASAVKVALRFPAEIAEAVAEALQGAQAQFPDIGSYRLLLRGLPILGAARYGGIYRPLMAYLHCSSERVEVLGDMITESLAKIIAGVFDGDHALLTALIADANADEWVRSAALKAIAFLTFDGRIARETTREFLHRFDDERMAPPDHIAWDGWMEAVALLGLDGLSPRVDAAFEDGRIPSDVARKHHYRALLDAALSRPEDAQRFRDAYAGYIDDVFAEMLDFLPDDEDDDLLIEDDDQPVRSWQPQTPAVNPHKGVGRNDPCPCGSGKKFKKCCGASGG